MAKRKSRRSLFITRALIAELKEAHAACVARVAALEHENELHVKRMGAIQAELDHLRSKIAPL